MSSKLEQALQQTQKILRGRVGLLEFGKSLNQDENERLNGAVDIISLASFLMVLFGPSHTQRIISNNIEAFKSPNGDYPFIISYDPIVDNFFYHYHNYPQIQGRSPSEAQTFVDTLCPAGYCDIYTILSNFRTNATDHYTMHVYNWFDPISNEFICKRGIGIILFIGGREYLVGSGYTIPGSQGGCQVLFGEDVLTGSIANINNNNLLTTRSISNTTVPLTHDILESRYVQSKTRIKRITGNNEENKENDESEQNVNAFTLNKGTYRDKKHPSFVNIF